MKGKSNLTKTLELKEIEPLAMTVNSRNIFKFKSAYLIKYEADRSPINGYGACRLCTCSGYKSKNDKSDVCKVCGHHYSQHHH